MAKLVRRDSSTAAVTAITQIHDGHGPAAALTTIFTPPAACSTSVAPFYDTACMPPNFNSYLSSGDDYYSPAICPSGYTAACKLLQSQFHYYAALAPSETAVYCCPTGYLCATSDFEKGGGLCMTSSTNPYAFALQIRWQESDLPNLAIVPTIPATDIYFASTSALLTSTTGSAGISSTATKSIAAETSAVTAPLTTEIAHAEGLSTAAKVGISIAVPLTFLAALMTGLVLFCRRKGSKSTKSEFKHNSQLSSEYSEMEKTVQITETPYELPARQSRYELMDARPAAQELPPPSPRNRALPDLPDVAASPESLEEETKRIEA